MKKFEYQASCVYGKEDEDIQNELNKMGSEGWELVSIDVAKVYKLTDEQVSIQCVFKREIIN